ENIKPLDNAVEYLKPFKPVQFNFIGKDKKLIGLIAQDIQEVYPELIFDTGDEDYITYNDPGFKYILIKAIQEQQAQIEELKLKIGATSTDLTVQEDGGGQISLTPQHFKEIATGLGLLVTETGFLEVQELKTQELEIGSQSEP
ncbi:unnamed protein product, partial [marine sediment metagenome]